jgi:hypothetical protein
LPGRRSPGNEYQTILSGDINSSTNPGLDAGNSQHVIKVVGPFPGAQANEDQFVTINGFVITMGYADGPDSSYDNRGGGVLVRHIVQAGADQGSTAVNLIYCNLRENRAAAGGAMHSEKGGEDGRPVRVISCTFQDNRAADQGVITPVAGGLCMTGHSAGPMGFTPKGSVEITNSLFIRNRADRFGGGLFNGSAVVEIVNGTIADNQAGIVGGADGQGGGLYVNLGAPAPIVTNCIFWGNLAVGNDPQDSQIDGSATVTYCDVEDGWTGTGNVNVDPQFVDAVNGDYHPDYDSPVLDIGQDTEASFPNIPLDTFDVDDASGTTTPTPDGNRKTRIRGPSGDDIVVDLGFSEIQGICPGDCAAFDGRINVTDHLRLLEDWGHGGPCDIDNDGEVDVGDLNALLAAWGNCPASESAMMTTGEDETLGLILAFIESVGGANDSTVPLIIAFLRHLQ